MTENVQTYVRRDYLRRMGHKLLPLIAIFLVVAIGSPLIAWIITGRSDLSTFWAVVALDVFFASLCLFAISLGLVQGSARALESLRATMSYRCEVYDGGFSIDDGRIVRRYQWSSARRLVRLSETILIEYASNKLAALGPASASDELITAAQFQIALSNKVQK